MFIWKSENPCCFKHVKKDQLPVDYYSQSKAWMKGIILHDVLGKLNRHLKRTKRSILLLMDNAGCHPEDVKGKFSNIKVVFLPANTTSMLQPLDLGIIKKFKIHYRKLLLTFVLAKIEECTNPTEIVKSVTVLHALRWVAEGWKHVKSDTIQKCFIKAGIFRSAEVVSSPVSDGEDPFADLDIEGAGQADLETLIRDVQGSTDMCSVADFISGDHNLPIWQDFDDDWEQDFLNGLSTSSKRPQNDGDPGSRDEEAGSDDDDDGEGGDDELVCLEGQPNNSTIQQAISSLEDVYSFLDRKGHTSLASSTMMLISNLAEAHRSSIAAARQATLQEYFKS